MELRSVFLLQAEVLQSAICAVRLRGRYIPAAARLFLDILEKEKATTC